MKETPRWPDKGCVCRPRDSHRTHIFLGLAQGPTLRVVGPLPSPTARKAGMLVANECCAQVRPGMSEGRGWRVSETRPSTAGRRVRFSTRSRGQHDAIPPRCDSATIEHVWLVLTVVS
jgi:hypothetical protein